jgi:hypothetical protein
MLAKSLTVRNCGNGREAMLAVRQHGLRGYMSRVHKEPQFIVVRCGAPGTVKQPFIIRFRQQETRWVYENATAIPEAKVGGGDEVRLDGKLQEGPSYPGCPHCKARSFFLCYTCNKLTCWMGEQRRVTCSWCGVSAALGGEIESMVGRSG